MEESLKMIEKFLTCYHSQRRFRPLDKESKKLALQRSLDPLDKVLQSSYDDAITLPEKEFAMTKFSFTAHPLFGSLTGK
jgi:hypothetical protein